MARPDDRRAERLLHVGDNCNRSPLCVVLADDIKQTHIFIGDPNFIVTLWVNMELSSAFKQEILQLLPDEGEELLHVIGHTAPSVAVRVNVARGFVPRHDARRVPWCDCGAYCHGYRPAFTFDPLWHAGAYYVQDASSMFIHHVIKSLVTEPVAYLDLCAAPGGKTTAAMGALPADSLVVANDLVAPRARALADNVTRWGNIHSAVTCDAPATLGRLTHAFDVVAADVPCSGEGMMRKDDDAVEQWSPTLVAQCAARQRGIVDDVWPALRPGGLFIYSTCTYNRHENEEMIAYIADRYGATTVEVPTEPSWGIMEGIDTPFRCYRFMPHRVDGEGLFMAVLRKPDDEPQRTTKAKKSKPTPPPPAVRAWLAEPERYTLSLQGDNVVAVAAADASLIDLLRAQCHIVQAGVTLATVMGRKTIPHHALAPAVARLDEAFGVVELDYERAIAYLRGETLTLDAPRGYLIVTYRGTALGFVNNLGNRANNLYPKPLRILSNHAPGVAPVVVE